MAVKRIVFNLVPFPKPRGGINRAGKMWHSNPKYMAWKQQFTQAIAGKLTPGDFLNVEGYIFVFYIKPKRGQQPDLENMQGAIQDICSKLKLIPDDNFTIISNYITLSCKVKDESRFDFCLCNSLDEMFKAGYIIANELKEIKKCHDKVNTSKSKLKK